MKICSTVHILEKRLGSIERALEMLKEANFDLADLSLFFMKLGKEHRFSGDNYKEEAIKLGEYAKSIGIPFYQAHAPFEFDFKRHDLETEIIPTVYRSIEIAALAGCSCIVVHPLQHYGYFGYEEELFAVLSPMLKERPRWGKMLSDLEPNEQDGFFTWKNLKRELEKLTSNESSGINVTKTRA